MIECLPFKVTQNELNAYLSLIDPGKVNQTTRLPLNYISLFWQAFDLSHLSDGAILVNSTIKYHRHLYVNKTYNCQVVSGKVRQIEDALWFKQTLYVTIEESLHAEMHMTLKKRIEIK